MLAIPLALWEEWSTTQTMLEQASHNPARVVAITLAILVGTCAPILRWVCSGVDSGWLMVAVGDCAVGKGGE